MRSRSRWSSLLAVGLASLVTATDAAAQSGSLAMDTRTNIFLSGGNSYDFTPVGGAGLTPTGIALTAGTGRVLSLSAFGSSFFCSASFCLAATPDGPAAGNSNIFGMGGIGGIQAPTSGFLAALFLGPTLSASTPAQNVITDLDALSYAPGIGQVFFVGNGSTAADVMQQFLVPDGATHLYFGIADAFIFSGLPDFYDDNLGTYTIEYAVNGTPTTVPEPTTAALLSLGLVAFGVARRRRVV
jgi:hypothetical protein